MPTLDRSVDPLDALNISGHNEESIKALGRSFINSFQGTDEQKREFTQAVLVTLSRQNVNLDLLEIELEGLRLRILERSHDALRQEKVERCAAYFGLDKARLLELDMLCQADGLRLDIINLLEGYERQIDELQGMGIMGSFITHLKRGIGIKIFSVTGTVLQARRTFATNMSEFANQRWIINDKIQGYFTNLQNKIIPSAIFYHKMQSQRGEWRAIEERVINHPDNPLPRGVDGPLVRRRFNHGFIEARTREIQNIMMRGVNREGEFNTGWFSRAMLDNTNQYDRLYLREAGVIVSEPPTLLSREDKEIEDNAFIGCACVVAIQAAVSLLPMTLNPFLAAVGIAGIASSMLENLYNTFSDDFAVLRLLQSIGVVHSDYRMEKGLIDRFKSAAFVVLAAGVVVKGCTALQICIERFGHEKVNSIFQKVLAAVNTSLFNRAKHLKAALGDPDKVNPRGLLGGNGEIVSRNAFVDPARINEATSNSVVLAESDFRPERLGFTGLGVFKLEPNGDITIVPLGPEAATG